MHHIIEENEYLQAYNSLLPKSGARAVVIQAARKKDQLSCWLNRIIKERGLNKAVVAMANKMARMGWAILRYNTSYNSLSAVSAC